MRSIRNQLSLWRIFLVIGMAGIAIPIPARVTQNSIAAAKDQPAYLGQHFVAGSEDANVHPTNNSKALIIRDVKRQQDDYYERRRDYWEKRVDKRLEYRDEYLDEQTGDGKDKADAKKSKDKKDAKAGKDDQGDEDDSIDQEAERQQDYYERRREYYRDRLDREW